MKLISTHNTLPTFDYSIENGVVCIVDRDEGRTVTNGADRVIEYLCDLDVDVVNQPVIYRDTYGTWDQLVVHNGRFDCFASINLRDRDAAIAKVKLAWQS